MKGKRVSLKVGPLTIKGTGSSDIHGVSAVGSRDDSSAEAWRYAVQSPDNWSLTLTYLVFRWSREVRMVGYSDGTPEYLRMLKNRKRMSVYFDPDREKDWVELSHAEPKNPGSDSFWPTLKQADTWQLDRDAGFRFGTRIERLGGSLGRRQDLLGEARTRNNYQCAVFPHDDHRIPILCYVVTRVLALIRAH